MEKSIIGSNLLRLRKSKGLSQSEVAELAGISRQTYRNIENGKSIPKVSTLKNISTALEVKLQDLFRQARHLQKVRFRALKRMNSRDDILSEVAMWIDDYNYLEDLLDNHVEYKFESLANRLSTIPAGTDRAKQAANFARKGLNLGEKEAIRNIAGLLESNGIKIKTISLASEGFFGLSVSAEDGGPAVIVNVWERISVERWIFTAAHELGYLLLHLDAYDVNENAEDKNQEIEANHFASYFLMPEKAFESEWVDTYGLSFVDRVLKVKRIFRVSYKTVLYRLSEKMGNSIWRKFQIAYKSRTGKTLGISDEPEALLPYDFQQSMAEVLRSREPDSLSSSDFIEDRLSKLVRIAIEKDNITLSRGAEILGIDLATMRERTFSWE